MSGPTKIDEHSGTELTTHEWDGIKELNTPLPRWWLGLFFICIVIAMIYAALMPSIPFIHTYYKGVLHRSDRAAAEQAIVKMHEERAAQSHKLVGATLASIESDPELIRFAAAQGKVLFGDNCETCHGQRGRGNPGYPNLNDDVWLWGGTYADIKQTITHGIRANDDDTRSGDMPAWGKDEMLEPQQIDDVVEYVLQISGQKADASAASQGQTVFAENCAACHGENAKGNRELGAPDLTDKDWLYGGDKKTIHSSVYNGRHGLMPNWNARLSDDQIAALAYYVHSELGGGE